MLRFTFCSLLLATVISTLAAPSSQGHHHAPAPTHQVHPQHFFLRGNVPTQPWHDRNVVALPTSQQLGFENYTVSPTTPGLRFRPIQVTNGNYALHGDGENEGQHRAPFLVALVNASTRTAMMKVLYIAKPERFGQDAVADACPEGYECVADQWAFDAAGDDGVSKNFRFAGYKGTWEPFKDAGTEGWHVFWKGNAGVYAPVALDLVPVPE